MNLIKKILLNSFNSCTDVAFDSQCYFHATMWLTNRFLCQQQMQSTVVKLNVYLWYIDTSYNNSVFENNVNFRKQTFVCTVTTTTAVYIQTF